MYMNEDLGILLINVSLSQAICMTQTKALPNKLILLSLSSNVTSLCTNQGKRQIKSDLVLQYGNISNRILCFIQCNVKHLLVVTGLAKQQHVSYIRERNNKNLFFFRFSSLAIQKIMHSSFSLTKNLEKPDI